MPVLERPPRGTSRPTVRPVVPPCDPRDSRSASSHGQSHVPPWRSGLRPGPLEPDLFLPVATGDQHRPAVGCPRRPCGPESLGGFQAADVRVRGHLCVCEGRVRAAAPGSGGFCVGARPWVSRQGGWGLAPRPGRVLTARRPPSEVPARAGALPPEASLLGGVWLCPPGTPSAHPSSPSVATTAPQASSPGFQGPPGPE